MKVGIYASNRSMYYRVYYNSPGELAEFCENGDIKIVIHELEAIRYCISKDDLEILYIKKSYYYIPLFFNGRLL